MAMQFVFDKKFIQEIMQSIINNLKEKKANILIVNELMLKFDINELNIFSALPNSEMLNFLSKEILIEMLGKTENINEIRRLINSKIK